MAIIDLQEELKGNAYPGRGIVLGKSADGLHGVIAYFIMGRSVNSRNRVFILDGQGIKTKAFDESKLVDPSLIIYAPVRVLGDDTIVTNGDQTDTVYDFLKDGKTFEQALHVREFEPDSPNFTPRISGILKVKDNKLSYQLSILKSADGDSASCERFFFSYATPVNGQGHFIHTYQCDGNPIPSFNGEPTRVKIDGTIDQFSDMLWNALNSDNKVSLFTRFINLRTGETVSKIINKNK